MAADDPGDIAVDSTRIAPNDQIRVLQWHGGLDVAFCAKVLGDTGADVAFLEPATGHALRQRGSATGASPLFSYLHSGKRSIVVGPDDLDAVLASTDVVITDRLDEPWEELHARHPHLSAAVITPFGMHGPWARRPATDLTLQAASGGMAPRGAIGRAPLMVGGEPSAWFAGAVAAVSVLGILPRQSSTGTGELLDVSSFECTTIEHGMHPVTFSSMAQRPFQSTRGTPVPGIEPTSDGHVGFFVITGQQWLDFCAMIGRPDWADDERLFIATERRLRADELLGPIREWTMSMTTDEIVELASLMRIPVAPIGNGAKLPHIDQFVAEAWFVEHEDGFVQPRRPYRFEGEEFESVPSPDAIGANSVASWTPRSAPPPATRAAGDTVPADRLPLEGIRVADFTGFWAGPMASAILAGLGADVIHIEGPRRPDGIRLNSIRSMTEDQWWEWSPLFCGANTNKRDLAVDLSVPHGREIALRLLATCDVMIENFSPRVVDQLGLGPDVVRGVNEDIVVVRMPAFGLGGPWRDRVGFAQTIEQAVGLAFITGYPGEAPLIPNGMCDPLAGVFGAIAALVALAERKRTGTGSVVESPMVGAALATTAEQVIDFAASGRLHTSLGNASPLVEQEVLRCAGDDAWLAVSLPDGSARDQLRVATGAASIAELARWCADREAAEAAETLSAAGIAAAEVMWAHDTASNPQLVARGFFERIDHPVCGTHPYSSWPVRFGSGPHQWNRAAAPTMGQHNDAILSELGYSAAAIGELEGERVITNGVVIDQHKW